MRIFTVKKSLNLMNVHSVSEYNTSKVLPRIIVLFCESISCPLHRDNQNAPNFHYSSQHLTHLRLRILFLAYSIVWGPPNTPIQWVPERHPSWNAADPVRQYISKVKNALSRTDLTYFCAHCTNTTGGPTYE
jgi:hypothetical protein